MSTLDDRESAFENKLAHDAEMQFKADARANKLVGLWAAGLLGKEGEAAGEYAKEVIKADFEEAGHEDVVRKVAGDLGDKADADTIRAKMDELMKVAKAQLVDEAVVYVAPIILSDEHAKSAAAGRVAASLSSGVRFDLARMKRVGEDVELTYRRREAR